MSLADVKKAFEGVFTESEEPLDYTVTNEYGDTCYNIVTIDRATSDLFKYKQTPRGVFKTYLAFDRLVRL